MEVPDGKDKTKRVPVKTGLTDGLRTEITEGLKEGQEVAVPATVQSRWAQGGPGSGSGGPGSGGNFSRGMQRAAWGLSGAGGGSRSAGAHRRVAQPLADLWCPWPRCTCRLCRSRLDETYPYLIVDARYERVREAG